MIAVALAAPLVAPLRLQRDVVGESAEATGLAGGGTSAHLLGTDPLGRDMLSRVIWAARTSLGIAGISVLVAHGVRSDDGAAVRFYGGSAGLAGHAPGGHAALVPAPTCWPSR